MWTSGFSFMQEKNAQVTAEKGCQMIQSFFWFPWVWRRSRRCSVSKRNMTCASASRTTKKNCCPPLQRRATSFRQRWPPRTHTSPEPCPGNAIAFHASRRKTSRSYRRPRKNMSQSHASNFRISQTRPTPWHIRRSDTLDNDTRPLVCKEKNFQPNHQTKDNFEGCVDRWENNEGHRNQMFTNGHATEEHARKNSVIMQITINHVITWTNAFGKAET